MRHAVAATAALLALSAAATAQTRAGGEFQVNAYTTAGQSGARLAMEPDGDFVVVWDSDGQDGSYAGVFGRRFAASGTPRGGEIAVNSGTIRHQKDPAVAVGPRGDFVAVWTNDDASGNSVRGRRFDTAGSAVGGDFLVNTATTTPEYDPRVGMAADGRFVVAWVSQNGQGVVRGSGPPGIAGRVFASTGAPLGSQLVVNTYTTGSQAFPDVSSAPDGSFVAVWEDIFSGRDGSGSAIFGQRHDGSGNRLGAEFLVNTTTTGDQRIPSVSVSPAGTFVVVWSGPDASSQGVFARRFDPTGSPVGNDFLVNTNTLSNQFPGSQPVAHDAQGNFVVTYASQGDGSMYGILAQRFTASGARRGAEFQVNTYTTDNQVGSAVAVDEVGNFVVSWEGGGDGSDYGILAQRFGGLAPAALAVDTAGNQVLEPGETVDVRPSWRNFNGAAQTFAGGLSGITGPAGATYAITDGIGDYGAVADGAVAPCTDCYGVSVSNPSTRPALHWDASAVEGLTPDTQGEQKKWLLHVGRSFTDVPASSPFYRFVETLLHRGVTGGCGGASYCPASATSREQMAVFVLVAREGAGYAPPACGTTPMFVDVASSSPFCRWIEELARRGVVGGCGGGNYCPQASASREQMAVFVLRTLDPALNPPPCGTPLYADVPASSPFCRWIEELTRRGVVTGCGGGNYCPTANVSREQMSVFLSVTFGLVLYGP
jgi:hypothetical protein